jgi:hypothetical protein
LCGSSAVIVAFLWFQEAWHIKTLLTGASMIWRCDCNTNFPPSPRQILDLYIFDSQR